MGTKSEKMKIGPKFEQFWHPRYLKYAPLRPSSIISLYFSPIYNHYLQHYFKHISNRSNFTTRRRRQGHLEPKQQISLKIANLNQKFCVFAIKLTPKCRDAEFPSYPNIFFLICLMLVCNICEEQTPSPLGEEIRIFLYYKTPYLSGASFGILALRSNYTTVMCFHLDVNGMDFWAQF